MGEELSEKKVGKQLATDLLRYQGPANDQIHILLHLRSQRSFIFDRFVRLLPCESLWTHERSLQGGPIPQSASDGVR